PPWTENACSDRPACDTASWSEGLGGEDAEPHSRVPEHPQQRVLFLDQVLDRQVALRGGGRRRRRNLCGQAVRVRDLLRQERMVGRVERQQAHVTTRLTTRRCASRSGAADRQLHPRSL